MIQPTLIVLAAGMGSRYGGLKQIDSMGPHGETVIDYSVHDAIRAGFQKVIFIIRKHFESEFRSKIGNKFHHLIQVDYAFQDLHDLPEGHTAPLERIKPWGTTHAVLAARHLIDSHFVVINADDFYGSDAYQQIVAHFNRQTAPDNQKQQYVMVGYPLANTLSKHGHVNRGICSTNNDVLLEIEEHTEISLQQEGTCTGLNLTGQQVNIPKNKLVSMNFWGFPKETLPHLEASFEEFLIHNGQELKSECYLPSVIDNLIRSNIAECHVCQTSGTWFGVTYPDDKASVVRSIQSLVQEGYYPEKLWA